MDGVKDVAEWVSAEITDLAEEGPGFTLFVTLFLLSVGVVLLLFGRRRDHVPELGIALLAGGLFAFASYANQVTVEVSEFESTLAVTQDLSGFSPHGHSMDGLSLRNKNLTGADLEEADLEGADLTYSTLREAILRDADLRDAQLFYATFLRADLQGADFSGANLEGAEISTPSIAGATWDGATVHDSTCWNVTFADLEALTPDESGQAVLETVIDAGLAPFGRGVLGRVCFRKEVGESVQASVPPDTDPILLCASEPFLTRETCS